MRFSNSKGVKILPGHGYVNYDSLDSSEHNTCEVLQNFWISTNDLLNFHCLGVI